MNTKEAIGEVRKYARFIKAFEHLEAVAEALAQADNLIKERNDRADAVAALISEHETHLDAIDKEIQLQEKERDERAESAAMTRRALLGKAEAEARDITAEAQTKLDSISEESQSAAIQLREIRANVTKQQAVLGGITRKIEQAREQARKIIGG